MQLLRETWQWKSPPEPLLACPPAPSSICSFLQEVRHKLLSYKQLTTLPTNKQWLGYLNEGNTVNKLMSASFENTRPSWTLGSNSTCWVSPLVSMKWIYAPGREICIWPLVKQNTKLIVAGEEAKKMQGMHFAFQ